MFSVFLSIKTVVWLIVYFYLFLTPMREIPQRLFTKQSAASSDNNESGIYCNFTFQQHCRKSDPRDKVSAIGHPVAC